MAIYQASQAIYDLFDKAVVLYEGRQIYFGPAAEAKDYFERMGWLCPQRQTTGDFLTSVTNPQERQIRPGMENRVPRTPEEFETYWLNSPEYRALKEQIELYQQEFPTDPRSGAIQELREQKNFRCVHEISPLFQLQANNFTDKQSTSAPSLPTSSAWQPRSSSPPNELINASGTISLPLQPVSPPTSSWP